MTVQLKWKSSKASYLTKLKKNISSGLLKLKQKKIGFYTMTFRAYDENSLLYNKRSFAFTINDAIEFLEKNKKKIKKNNMFTGLVLQGDNVVHILR